MPATVDVKVPRRPILDAIHLLDALKDFVTVQFSGTPKGKRGKEPVGRT
jgi:hypothetical protein